MRSLAAITLALAGAVSCHAADSVSLTPQEVADGWLLLLDGSTLFGCQVGGEVTIRDGALVLGTNTGSVTFLAPAPHFRLVFTSEGNGTVSYAVGMNTLRAGLKGKLTATHEVIPESGNDRGLAVQNQTENGVGRQSCTLKYDAKQPVRISLTAPAGEQLRVSGIRIRPEGLTPLFNGKDLTGWKKYTGDEKRSRSDFTVTSEGWLHMKSGPGDLQTAGRYDDFLLQLESKTNGKGLNSGVFFRCLPNQYQNGYEAQIHNVFKDNDRTRPADFGTGAIYRRVPARRVVPDDNEWFTLTVAAQGNRIRTWVNGYPTVDWTDTRPANENPRNGSKTGAGHISLQGHDPGTDVLFRNLRVAAWKK